MIRIAAETLLACCLILALHQWAYYEGNHIYAVKQELFTQEVEARIDKLKARAEEISTGMDRCWREWRFMNWKHQWERE